MPECKKCNKSFKRDQDLKMHNSKVHSKSKQLISEGSMRSIWKFPLKVEDEQVIHPPIGWEFLCIQIVLREPVMYMLVNPDNPPDSVKLIIKGTGHKIQEREVGDYLGTFQLHDGLLVFHVFYPYVPKVD